MSVFYDLSKTPRNILNQAIVRAIVSENNGAWLDPSDLSTLYQDAAGTTPVTAVEQPVGKMLDKSGNGYHATQSITASQPTLSARYNLLTKTEDFSNAAWSKVRLSVSEDRLIEDYSASTTHEFNQIISSRSIPSGTKMQLNVSIKPNGRNIIKIFIGGVFATAGAMVNINTGVVLDSVGFAITASKSGDYCDIRFNATTAKAGAPAFIIRLCDDSGNTVYTGNGISGVYLKRPSVLIGDAYVPYQRVNTATDYDTDERYFKKYLRFDGIDDYLVLPYMGLYGGGAASIICARDALSQATDTYIISERSTTDADPKYFPSRQLANGGNMDAYISDDAGTVVLDTAGSVFSGASDAVVRSVIDTGNNIKLFKNGQLAANDNYTRAGALTLNNTTIGASVSTTTSNYVVMKLYGLIITKSAITDAQRVACERYLGRKSGVQL